MKLIWGADVCEMFTMKSRFQWLVEKHKEIESIKLC